MYQIIADEQRRADALVRPNWRAVVAVASRLPNPGSELPGDEAHAIIERELAGDSGHGSLAGDVLSIVDELAQRIARIYSAIGALVETDLSKFPAKRFISSRTILFVQDFSGGMSPEEIDNAAQLAIYNIAHFGNPLKRWARENEQDPAIIKEAEATSELQVIRKLSNLDKHAYPDRHGGSKQIPCIVELSREMRLTTKPEAGSSVVMTFGKSGEPVIGGSGSGTVVTTGQVVDQHGVVIGDLYDLEGNALKTWEQVLGQYGLAFPDTD